MDEIIFKERGSNVVIYQPVVLIKPEAMVLKSNILVSEFAYLAAGQGLYVGNYIHISAHSIISGGGVCILEDFSGLSASVRLITGSEDINGGGLTNPTIPAEFRKFYRSHVVVKRHAFLATNVVVHPGVTVGEGAVVASGSVVTKDVEPWTINMGIPAKPVRVRPKDTILRMEEELVKKSGMIPSDFSNIIS